MRYSLWPYLSQRAYSIKTRIKTIKELFKHPPCIAQRAYSIKTRIKTPHLQALTAVHCLREHIPLKQGLRLWTTAHKCSGTTLREHIPLKQGLRHRIIRHVVAKFVLREHIPLKQGLRPTNF